MKIATRYLLPLEIFMALVMLSWGISGWAGGGVLWLTLQKTGQNTEWGVALCLVGLVQLATTLAEWCIGRRWANAHLQRSVSARLCSAFVSAVVWLYVCFTVATLPNSAQMFVLWVQAPAGILFSVWIWAANFKAACVLDPSVPTTRLQRELERDESIRFSPH